MIAWVLPIAVALLLKAYVVDHYFPTAPMSFLIWLPITVVVMPVLFGLVLLVSATVEMLGRLLKRGRN